MNYNEIYVLDYRIMIISNFKQNTPSIFSDGNPTSPNKQFRITEIYQSLYRPTTGDA